MILRTGIVKPTQTSTMETTGNNASNQQEQQTMSIYTDEGYTSRRDYLENLADDYGVNRETVFALAAMLGSSEDFDGLVTTVEDIAAEQESRDY
jgi:glycerol-3-phosphate dehydrogenase